MKEIEFTNDLKEYELTHWNAHRNDPEQRSNTMEILFGKVDFSQYNFAVDVGCGPRCGIFQAVKFSKMVAVDPLWDRYNDNKLNKIPDGVETICADAQSFSLEDKADVIFSFNSLDHSGDLSKSYINIMSNLSDDGVFYFHIHMRTKEQLNAGHKMLITEKEIDDILSPYKVVSKKIEAACPLDKKKYRSYIASVKNK